MSEEFRQSGEEPVDKQRAFNKWLDGLDDEDRAAADELLSDPEAMSNILSDYRDSKESAADQEAYHLRIQKKYDNIIAKFEEVDIQNPMKILEWLQELADNSDYIFLEKNHEGVINRLMAAGYKPATKKPTRSDYLSQEKMVKYLIEWAINMLKGKHGLHPMFSVFVDRLKTRGRLSMALFGVNPSKFSPDSFLR